VQASHHTALNVDDPQTLIRELRADADFALQETADTVVIREVTDQAAATDCTG
jgi:hypothetical protein